MSGIITVVPVVCNNCKFDFEYPQTDASSSVVCPVCGATLSSLSAYAFSSIRPATPPTNSSPKPSPPRAMDWKILFLTVCCQLVILIVGTALILVSYGKMKADGIADSTANGKREMVPAASSPKVSMQLTSLSFPESAVPAKATPPDVEKQEIPPPPKLEEKKPETPSSPKLEEKKPETPPSPKPEEKKPETPPSPKPEEKKPEAPPPPKPEEKKPEEKKPSLSPPSDISKAVEKVPEKRPEPNLPTREDRLRHAMLSLAEARILCATDGVKSLQLTLQAVRGFKEIGQEIPGEAYWILGQSFASQSWGDALLEGVPPLEHLTVSSDGHWLLTGSADQTVWIWDLMRAQKGGEGFKLDVVDAKLAKVVFAPDLRFVVGGTTEGKIYLWNMTVRNPTEAVIGLPNTIQGLRDLMISPDGRWLVAYGGQTNTPLAGSKGKRESDPLTNSLRRALGSDIVLVGYQDAVGIVENGSNAPLRHDANAIWLWDLKDFQGTTPPTPIVLRGHEKPIRAMTFSEDSRWLATGGEDATVRVFDLKGPFPGSEQAVLKGHRLDVTALAFPPDNAWIASGSRDNTIRIWKFSNAFSSSGAITLEGHLGWISSLVVDKTGERLISGSFDKTIRIWAIPKNLPDRPITPPTIIYGDQGAIRQLAITADGKKLLSQGVDSSLRIRSLEGTFENEHSLILRNRMLPISKFSVTQDDRWLIFNYDNLSNLADCGVRIWPLRLDDLLRSTQ